MDRLYEIRKKVSDYIKLNSMIEPGDFIVAGVSGGADSMCLLCMLIELEKEYGISLAVVHVHHGIRGSEADGDMNYVKEFCEERGIEFYGVKYNIPQVAREEHLSSEEAGRIKRYGAFQEVIREKGNKGKIAVAHNLEDSTETLLLNLFRGTGLTGLTGIQPVRDNIIRPVLCLTREEILTYLKEKKILYRTDGTNQQEDYTRNKIRLKIMPYVKENINERAVENISRAGQMLRDVNAYMEKQAERFCRLYVYCDEKNGSSVIDGRLWEEEPVIVGMVIRKAIEKTTGRLKDITAVHVEDIVRLGNKKVSKSADIPYGVRAVREYDGIKLVKCKGSQTDSMKDINFNLDDILAGGGYISTGKGAIRFTVEKNESVDLRENLYTKWMNYDILKDNLSVRNRRAGDYMTIDSEGHTKKLKDLLIDLKIPRDERDSLVLLTRGSEVLWIIGCRMSESCKISEDMENVVRADYLKR